MENQAEASPSRGIGKPPAPLPSSKSFQALEPTPPPLKLAGRLSDEVGNPLLLDLLTLSLLSKSAGRLPLQTCGTCVYTLSMCVYICIYIHIFVGRGSVAQW